MTKQVKTKRTRQAVNWKPMAARLSVVAALALCGWALMQFSSAATNQTAAEAESGTLAGKAKACQAADTSGGLAVRFGYNDCNQTSLTYQNPIKPSTADPGVMKYGNKYYLVSTAGVPSFPIYESTDLISWVPTGKSVFNGTHPWGKDRFWAPEIHQVGSRFAVYYSASDSAGALRVGVATADSPTGPYTDLGKPLVQESFWTIDVNFFRDDDGRQYVYYKEDGGDTRIFGREVAQDGVTFIGNRVEVLRKGLGWEGTKGIEGSWVMKKDGQYYMFYSGNLYTADSYGVGVARSSGPLTPFSKKGNPILSSGNRWKGPGHNSVATFGANDYLVYHAYDGKAGVGGRFGMVDKIIWSGGWPTIAGGKPSETAQPYPN